MLQTTALLSDQNKYRLPFLHYVFEFFLSVQFVTLYSLLHVFQMLHYRFIFLNLFENI